MISILTKKKIAINISMRILISDVILQTHAAYTVSSMNRINSGGIFNRNCMQLYKIRKQPSALLGHIKKETLECIEAKTDRWTDFIKLVTAFDSHNLYSICELFKSLFVPF